MSWANVRGAMVTALEALTPTTATLGAPTFLHVEADQVEDAVRDRTFAVRMTAPPSQVGEVLNGTSWRWLTSCEVVIKYLHTRKVADDEDRISEDVQQIQQTLLQKGNHHANVEGVVPQGEGYAATTIAEDPERNYLVTIGLTIHHL